MGRTASAQTTGFKPSSVTEIIVGEDGAESDGESHIYLGRCESCEKVILNPEDYRADPDGISMCAKCADEAPVQAITQ